MQKRSGTIARKAEPSRDVLAIVVSYNTRELTRKAVASLLSQDPAPEVVVVDNASSDGSAEALTAAWPSLRVLPQTRNLGFARAVNLVANATQSRWILLLNPDARLEEGALSVLLDLAETRPGHGVYGGRTVSEDGALNPLSCSARQTPWSTFCTAIGLSHLFPGSSVFNAEGMGGWPRDTIREVDIIAGCFALIDRRVWSDLGGFDARFWMYGEDADFCLRSRALTGKRPLFTPDAVAQHVGRASEDDAISFHMSLARGKIAVARSHWPGSRQWMIRPFWRIWAGVRALAEGARRVIAISHTRRKQPHRLWRELWRRRAEWLDGY